MDLCFEGMVKNRVISLFKAARGKAANREKLLLYPAVEKVVPRNVSKCPVNEIIHMKVGRLVESQNFVQHLTTNLLRSPSFTVTITLQLKQHAQVAVADEKKLYDQSITCSNQEE